MSEWVLTHEIPSLVLNQISHSFAHSWDIGWDPIQDFIKIQQLTGFYLNIHNKSNKGMDTLTC